MTKEEVLKKLGMFKSLGVVSQLKLLYNLLMKPRIGVLLTVQFLLHLSMQVLSNSRRFEFLGWSIWTSVFPVRKIWYLIRKLCLYLIICRGSWSYKFRFIWSNNLISCLIFLGIVMGPIVKRFNEQKLAIWFEYCN